jgi:hypothetical protein
MALLPNDMLVVNANENNVAGMYTTDGQVTGNYIEVDSAPSGLVVNKTGGFKVSDGGKTRASDLIFVTEEGTILGWNSSLASPTAVVAVNDSDFGALYKGAAILGGRLYAAELGMGSLMYTTVNGTGWVRSPIRRLIPVSGLSMSRLLTA